MSCSCFFKFFSRKNILNVKSFSKTIWLFTNCIKVYNALKCRLFVTVRLLNRIRNIIQNFIEMFNILFLISKHMIYWVNLLIFFLVLNCSYFVSYLNDFINHNEVDNSGILSFTIKKFMTSIDIVKASLNFFRWK